jgi:hypothetical protein
MAASDGKVGEGGGFASALLQLCLGFAHTITNHDSDMTDLRTAAQRVYEIPELKECIFGWSERRDVAVMMRVDKAGMADVARMLYQTMRQDDVQHRVERNNVRSSCCCGFT